MAGIHGIVYVIIGAFVALVSWKVDFEDLIGFFYIGLLFAAVGLFKMLFSLMRKNEEKKILRHKANSAAQSQIHAQSQRGHHAGQHHLKNQPQYKRCPRCHNVLRVHDNFCPRCGSRV